jgi:hypothetical protein
MTFRVGQKVVCVDGIFIDPRWYRSLERPVEKRVYTVRGYASVEYLNATREPNVRCLIYLEEIVNPPVMWDFGVDEIAWPALRFRPVVERKTDISIFTAMLNPSKEHVRS